MKIALTPALCRQARIGLGWSRERLAAMAGLSSASVARFEDEKAPSRFITVRTIRAALEAAGIEFARGKDGEDIVRLKGAEQAQN